ncbi:hypothetical protein [Streptomyces sp. NPDC058985]|uniref:hypothetical protein n=1 Tax=Streptomyces sp. NPDC058985 TaxID=3346684 RepID=UPI003677C711
MPMPMPMPIRRSAAAAALVAIAVTGCGTQKAERPQSAPSWSSPPPTSRPKCAQPAVVPSSPPSSPAPRVSSKHQEQNQDLAPHHAENHAYRMQARMTAEKRAIGEASAKLIRTELEKVRQEGGAGEYGAFSDERIAAALNRLGCGEEHGVYIGNGFYSVHTGVTCVSGRVTKDELTSKVHGAYIEPQPGTGPCVKNRGGH